MCDDNGPIQPHPGEGNWSYGRRVITDEYLPGIWRAIRRWWDGDPEQDLQNAETILTLAVDSGQFGSHTERLTTARDNLRSFNSAVTRIQNWRDRLQRIVEIHDIIETLNENNDYSDEAQRERAAAAFGELFATLGSIAAESEIPALSMYGTLFANSGDFFTNMLANITAHGRQADRAFEEAAPYTNRRGMQRP